MTVASLYAIRDERPLSECLADLIDAREELAGMIGALPSSEHGGPWEKSAIETHRAMTAQIDVIEAALAIA